MNRNKSFVEESKCSPVKENSEETFEEDLFHLALDEFGFSLNNKILFYTRLSQELLKKEKKIGKWSFENTSNPKLIFTKTLPKREIYLHKRLENNKFNPYFTSPMVISEEKKEINREGNIHQKLLIQIDNSLTSGISGNAKYFLDQLTNLDGSRRKISKIEFLLFEQLNKNETLERELYTPLIKNENEIIVPVFFLQQNRTPPEFEKYGFYEKAALLYRFQ